MPIYRKKSIDVKAEQWSGPPNIVPGVICDDGSYYVITINGQRTDIEPGDYIVEEPDGEHYYPCKPDIFEERHDLIT